MEKAYMIRNDGKAFPVTQHLYGNMDEVTETLFAGEWLYDHTQNEQTKQDFIDLVAVYARFYEQLTITETLEEQLIAVIKSYPYRYLSAAFVSKHIDAIKKAFDMCELSVGNSMMQALSKIVIDELNQEFLRARYGGMYNTKASSREMVFRVSSNNFNWYNIIWQFVYDHKPVIDTVTIVRDEESTGVPNYFYHAKDGSEYNNYPVDDFIMEKGNPVIESKDPVRNLLLSGAPLSALKTLPMNKERIAYRVKCLLQQENRCRSFWLLDDE